MWKPGVWRDYEEAKKLWGNLGELWGGYEKAVGKLWVNNKCLHK